MRIILMAIVALAVPGCSFFAPKQDNTLAISECPELTKLGDDTFGATTMMLKAVADQYHLCRKAAMGVKK